MAKSRRYLIPGGLVCSVARVTDPTRRWTKHVVKEDFICQEDGLLLGSSGALVLTHGGWHILTRRDKVRRVE